MLPRSERLAPLRAGKACAAAEACPVYLVHGSAGNNEGVDQGGTVHKKLVRGSNYADRGFVEFEVYNRSVAAVRFVRASDSAVLDSATLLSRAARAQPKHLFL